MTVWRTLFDLRKHIFIRSILTALVLSTAFTTGLMLEIGAGFVPIIDKGNLLILLAFYGSALALVVYFIRLLVETTLRQNQVLYATDLLVRRALLTLRPATNYADGRRRMKPPKTRPFNTPALLLLIVVPAAVVAYITRLDWIDLPYGLDTFQLGTAFFLSLFIAIIIELVGRRTKVRRLMVTLRNLFLATANILALVTAFVAGQLWIGYLRTEGPLVTIQVAKVAEPKLATVALLAGDGLIVFYRGDDRSYFLPWAEIVNISTQLGVAKPTS